MWACWTSCRTRAPALAYWHPLPRCGPAGRVVARGLLPLPTGTLCPPCGPSLLDELSHAGSGPCLLALFAPLWACFVGAGAVAGGWHQPMERGSCRSRSLA
eukprot:1178698-Prorocentrum_minimum.AAC.8